jgi:hypothetical protein
MSPEQARGEAVDARADVFALGATLFYVLAGTLPWHGGSTEMIDHVGAGRPPDWKLMPEEVPPDLRAIVEKAMATRLDERYADAGALAADLRNFTLGNLVVAYEYGWFAKLGRFVRKNRAAVSIAVISVVILAIVGVVSIRRIVSERDDANGARALAEKRQREAREAADRLLLAHANELVDVDPTEAIAALRTMPPDSSQWPQAWGVASGAFYRGIPFGFVGLSEPSVPQIAADNKHAIVAGLLLGQILLIDIEKRESRDLGRVGLLDGAAWFDTTHFIVVTRSGVIIFDIVHDTRRAIPELAGASLYSNREGLAIFHLDGKLYELTSADGQARMIDQNVGGYTPSSDLKSAIVVRGRHRELWSRGKTYGLPDVPADVNPGRSTYVVAGNMVAIFEPPDLFVWDLVGDRLVQRGTWHQPGYFSTILVANGNPYIASGNLLQRADIAGAPIRDDFGTFTQTRTGYALSTSDGRLWIRDHKTLFKLGRRQSRYQRLDQSIDGRWLMATTDTAEVLVFDLAQVRPTTSELPPAEVPVLLTSDSVWTNIVGTGLFRRPFATNKATFEISQPGMMSLYTTSADERVVAGLDIESRVLVAAALGKTGMRDVDVSGFGVEEHGIIYGKRNGEIWHWDPSGRTQVAKLDGSVDIVVASEDHVVANLGDHELVRINMKTRAEEYAAVAGRISRVALSNTGDAWFIADSRPYRWVVGAIVPAQLETPEPVDGLILTKIGAVFHSPRSFLVFQSDATRVIARASAYFSNLDFDLIVTNDAQGKVSIISASTGASFDIPMPMAMVGQYPMTTSPGRVGFTYGAVDGSSMFGIYNLSVPQDPAKLRQWLATITNAKPVPNSEAVAWPSR